MSKYILKKKYPGSPEVGTEIIRIIRSRIMGLTKPRVLETYMIKGQNTFSIKNPQDYPEFWEKMMELDYEILSFKTTDKHPGANDVLSILNTINSYTYEYSSIPCTLEEMLNSVIKGYNVIYSVKRLSDNTILTVGDRYQVVDPIKEVRTIATFYISENKLYIASREYGYSELKEIQMVKQPIYKTEDNVEIFEGDDVHWVNTYNYTYLYSLPFSTGAPKLLNTVGNIYKVFSTKEAAEEWLIYNKPCLSINDVLSVGQRGIVDEGKLKQIVKNKK